MTDNRRNTRKGPREGPLFRSGASRGSPLGTPALAVLAFALVVLLRGIPAAEPLPPVKSLGEGRERLRFLKEELPRVEEWVEANLESEFASRHPDLSDRGEGANRKESPQQARERGMRARIARSELQRKMRAERAEWLSRETEALLSREIGDNLPVRLGPYDSERGEYPLLLGFGWPSSIIVRMRVPEREREIFAARFPKSYPARFRLNEKGEVTLVALDRGRSDVETRVFIAPPGPKLLWQGSHDSWVTAVSYHPDGSQVITAGADGVIAAWDAETGNRVWKREDAELALALAYGPDGSVFASGGADSHIRLRRAATGEEAWKAASSGMIFSLDFSADGRHIVSGDDGGTLRVWSVSSGREILRADLGSPVRCLAVSPGGKAVAAGTEGGSVVLWEMVSGRQLWRREVEWPVFSVDVGAGGLVAFGGGMNRLTVLRESDGGEVWNRKMDGEIRSVRFDASGRLLGAGGGGYQARVFLGENGEPVWTASVDSPIRSIAFGPDGRKLLVGSADFGVRQFEVIEGDRIVAAYWSFGILYVDRDSAVRIFR